jgi:hypothetical protein
MSEKDVLDLEDEDLISDYQCIKIQKDNVMENIDQVSAIWQHSLSKLCNRTRKSQGNNSSSR